MENDAENEDEAGRGQAAQKNRERQAQAPRGVEATHAGRQGAEAPRAPAQGEDDRQGGRAAAASARPLSVRGKVAKGGQGHATGKGRRQDAPAPQEDPQEGQGLRRRTVAAVPSRRRDRATGGRLR